MSTQNRKGKAIPIYQGPTEDETLDAIGTDRDEVERLAEGFGMPSGLEEEDE